MSQITYPTLPLEETAHSHCCYSFHRFLKLADEVSEEITILKAIELTAEQTDYSVAYIAKVLVDHGLSAPRRAFPSDYIETLEEKSSLNPWAAGAMSYAENKLAKFWQMSFHFNALKKEALTFS